jgi:hypothetical protein
MPRNTNLDAAIRALVAEEVEAALSRHQRNLERLEAFLGAGGGRPAGRRGPGRPPSTGRAGARTRRPRGARAQDRGDASKFEKGQKVQINVGRGQKLGKVVAIDEATNSVLVKREDNGKEVKRPARGVSAI